MTEISGRLSCSLLHLHLALFVSHRQPLWDNYLSEILKISDIRDACDLFYKLLYLCIAGLLQGYLPT